MWMSNREVLRWLVFCFVFWGLKFCLRTGLDLAGRVLQLRFLPLSFLLFFFFFFLYILFSFLRPLIYHLPFFHKAWSHSVWLCDRCNQCSPRSNSSLLWVSHFHALLEDRCGHGIVLAKGMWITPWIRFSMACVWLASSFSSPTVDSEAWWVKGSVTGDGVSYVTAYVALIVKNRPADAGDERDMGSIPWSERSPRAWQSTPVFLPRESHGQRSLVDYSPKSGKESDMTKAT